MSFQALSHELTGTLPGLSPFLADTFINRAWREVRDARQWSFFQDDGQIICPAQVTAGSVAVTQYQATITADATASAALLALNPIPGLTNMQIRFGGSTAGSGSVSPLYSIVAVDDTVPAAIVLTLDQAVTSPTNATTGYQCYRAYVRPPADDFLGFTSLVDYQNALTLTNSNQRLSRSSIYFDMRDPQRQAQGLAYYLGAYKGQGEDQARPQYEFWPHPTQGQMWYCRFQRRGLDFTSAADTPPPMIPDELIMHRANGWHAYPWAAQNVGHFPGLRGVGWVNLILTAKQNYYEVLRTTKIKDQDQQLSENDIWNRGHGLRRASGVGKGMWDFPIDSAFLQAHLINF